jgi:hypothetical protein
MTTRYQVNAPDVVFEVFDSEIMVISLKSGHYYSVRESGVLIWTLVVGHHPVEVVARQLAARYGLELAAAQRTTGDFVARLLAENLIVESAVPEPEAPPPPAGPPAPLAEPVLETFTDIRDLLLIDPVHDVEPEGWPVRARNPDRPSP